MSDEEALDFLDYVSKDIRRKKRLGAMDDIDVIVNKQLKTLPLKERNQLISLLTHQQEDKGHLNEQVLYQIPSLRKRSEILLAHTKRKIREDKIDLQFVSDFMHNYCRYVYYLSCFSFAF